MTATTRPASRAGGAVAVRAAIAWCLGLVGAVGAAWGWGPVDLGPSAQAAGVPRVVVATGLFVLVATALRRRPPVVAAAALLTVSLTTALTAANLGRAPGLVASLSVVTSWASLLPPRADPGDRADRGLSGGADGDDRILLVPTIIVAVVQLLWIADSPTALVLGLLAFAAVIVGLGCLAPDVVEPIEAPLHGRARSIGSWVEARWQSLVRLDIGSRLATVPSWHWWSLVAALLTAAVMAPLFARFAREPWTVLGFGDYVVHLRIASGVEFFPPRVAAPHPVFHFAVAATTWLGGLVVATTVVMSIVVAGTVLALVWFGRRPFAGRGPLDPGLAIAYALGYFLVEAPGRIANFFEIGNQYDWAPTNHMYLSPTDTMLVPFAIVFVYLLGRTMDRVPEAGRRDGWMLAAAAAITTTVKPSMTLNLLAAVPVVLILSRRMDRRSVGFLALWFYLPSALVVGLQTWMLEVGVEGLPKAGIAIRPMETIRLMGLNRVGPLLFLPLLVVVFCLWADWRRYLSDTTVRLSLWSVAAGLAILFLFNETGARSLDGTFTKPAFMAFIVLHLVSWRFLAGEFRFGVTGRRRAWVAAAAIFLLVGLIAAVLSYLDSTGLMLMADRGRA